MEEEERIAVGVRLEELTPGMSHTARVEHFMLVCGCSQPTVSRWFTGNNKVGSKNAKSIAKHHRVNAGWVRHGDEYDKYIANEDCPNMKRIRAKWLSYLTLDDREEVADIVEGKARRNARKDS